MASVSGVYFVGIWNGFWSWSGLRGFSPIAILFPKCLSLIAQTAQLWCLQCETRGKKGMTLFFCPHKIWTLCISHIHRANAMKQGFIMILMESISVVCTRPPHHISIYPIHPVPKGHPCAPRINRLNGHNGRLNEHNRRDCHYGTTRHEALSKIGPFSQIGAFQTHNWDKCTISILLQKCDTTKGSFFSSR